MNECTGIMTGWASAAVPALRSNTTSLLETGAISSEQASWIPALKSLTFVLNIPLFGFIANRYGRKWPLNFLAIPLMVRPKEDTYKNPMMKTSVAINTIHIISFSDLMAAHLLCKKYLLYLCGAFLARHGYRRRVFTVSILFCGNSS